MGGGDIYLDVACYKVVSLKHVFTTDTPWRESKALTEQGYGIAESTSKYVVVHKNEHIQSVYFKCSGERDSFENLQELYKEARIHYQHWCKWDFTRYSRPLSKHDMEPMIRVWDELWSDVFKKIDEEDKKYRINYNHYYHNDKSLAKLIHSEMLKIFQYVLDNEDVQVHISIYDEFPYD
jgi:hypothetical protein